MEITHGGWLTEMILHRRYHMEENEDARWRNPRCGGSYVQQLGSKTAHSAPIGTFAEIGLIGLLLLCGMVVSTGVFLRQTARRAFAAGADFVGRVANALVLSLIGWALSSLFIQTETSRPLWIIIGLALALPRLIPARKADTA